MIKYRCPRCEQKLESPNADIGNQDTCPMCGHQYTVPERSGRTRKILAIILLILAVGGVSIGWILSQNKKGEVLAAETPPSQATKKESVPILVESQPEALKKDADIPIASMAQFRPLIKDYGMTVTKESKSGEFHSLGLKIHPSITNDGYIIFLLNSSDEVLSVTYLFEIPEDTARHKQLQTLAFCNDLLECCGWDSSDTPFTQDIIQTVIDIPEGNKKQIITERVSNGTKAHFTFTPRVPMMLGISRETPLLKNRKPLPYKPQFFGTDSEVGLWHLEWKKIEKNEFATTFSWRITVANKSSVKRRYSLTCSAQDKDGFEIETGYANTIPIAPGEHTAVTGRVMVMGSAAKKVSNFLVTAAAY
jgi:DNA-directed RNA polymerase subunit RPC12/RpoP